MKKDVSRRDSRILLFTALVLTLIGLVFIYSASSVFASERFGSAHYFFKKQAFFLIPAFLSFFIFSIIPIRLIEKYTSLMFFSSLFLTAMTILPNVGIRIHGSNRWLNLYGFSFQPSEFLKLFFVLYIALVIDRKKEYLKSFFYGYLPFLIILAVTFIVLLKQPDFGSVITLFLTSFIMLFVADFKFMYLLLTLTSVVPIALILVFSKAYRLNRILIFLNPWSDPRGRGFQIIQSLIAIGSGHIWGLGISNSKQKFFYLPMQHTDFIFPIIAEETGFVGATILILLFVVFCLFGIRVAMKMKTAFSFFSVLGFVVLISIQAVVNLMVTTGLLPTKGLGLPFVSYGGTALVCLWSMMGLIANFVRDNRLRD